MNGKSDSRSLLIAQFAPLIEPVPPVFYGGIERVVFHLTEELIRMGHRVVLFASGDSQTRAELIPCCSRALRLNPTLRDPLPDMLKLLSGMRNRLEEFDVLHFHTDLIKYPLFRNITGRPVTTVHMPPDCPIYGPRLDACPNTPVVAISENQKAAAPAMNWVGTVYHGVPHEQFAPVAQANGDYLAFLSRIEPDKRPDRAIEIAARSGFPIKLAGKIGDAHREYFERDVKPHIDGRGVEFFGEINEVDKSEFLGHARALLFPIQWREAFGLVMIEAMACGTPVIAFSNGSVPEVVEDGVTGFVVENVEQAVEAVHRADELDRTVIRARFESRFSVARMTKGYLEIYESLQRVPARLL